MPAYSSFAFIVFLITSTAFIIIFFLPKIDFTCNVHFYLPFFIDMRFVFSNKFSTHRLFT